MELKDPVENRKLKRITRVLIMVFALIIGAVYLSLGNLAAKGALIGCGVVAGNYFISREFLKKLIFSDKLPVYFIIFYVAKLGVSVAIIYLSIKTGVDLIGLLIGLSSFWVTSILSIFFRVDNRRLSELE